MAYTVGQTVKVTRNYGLLASEVVKLQAEIKLCGHPCTNRELANRSASLGCIGEIIYVGKQSSSYIIKYTYTNGYHQSNNYYQSIQFHNELELVPTEPYGKELIDWLVSEI